MSDPTLGFRDRVVLVTGAAKGIGAATAHLFGRLGARVAVHFHVDRAGAEKVASMAGNARVYQADLRSWSAAEALINEVEATLGSPDVVVINHGIWNEAPIATMTEQAYAEMFDSNLRGAMALSGATARAMQRSGKGGSIVLIASTAGQRGEANHSHYAASKGAVISLTKSLAVELAPHRIRVNCVAPGWVITPMSEKALSDPTTRATVDRTIPLGRVAQPEEIAGPIAFVASDWATFVTGEVLNVNGGAVLCG